MGKKWECVHGFVDHVIPVDDDRPHVCSELCWCNPLPGHTDEKNFWVHHSADGREYFEPDHRPEWSRANA